MTWRLRCPDCDNSRPFTSESSARTAQRRVPCPNCNRMRALSNDNRRHRVAA